ncbi:Crp/Fnr family transcriptional regulator [Ekhidna sp.]
MNDAITKSMQSYGSFTAEELELFHSQLDKREIAKGESILDKGETCMEISFLKQGSFKQFYRNSELDEVIINLFAENSWVLDHSSFTGQKPSKCKIEAFEDSEILTINVHHLHELIGRYPSFFALGKILEVDRSFDGKSPEEKYLKLLDQNPVIIQKFPLKYIASYLGMTPETLSRVRRKIL